MRARGYRDRAAESLELARNESDPDVQNRYVTIAQHYLTLAEAEERSADQKSVERRSRAALNSEASLPLASLSRSELRQAT